MAARRLGADRRSRPDRRDRRRGRRPPRACSRPPRSTTPIPPASAKRWLGHPPNVREAYTWPETGPGFRPEQHLWQGEFPFPGSGALNRLCVHPAIVDFAERALQSDRPSPLPGADVGEVHGRDELRAADAHRPQPLVAAVARARRRGGTSRSFLYLSDVHDGNAPTHLVRRADSGDRATTVPLALPRCPSTGIRSCTPPNNPRPACAARSSRTATDVFHRGVDLTEPGAARFLLAVAFKLAGQDWIGYTRPSRSRRHRIGSRSPKGRTPRELELFGFPPPGHPIWDASSCSTRPPSATRNSIWLRGGARYRDSVSPPNIEIPDAHLRPRDGRFGSGPSKVPHEAVAALADAAPGFLGTSHRKDGVRSVVRRIRDGPRRPVLAPRRLRSADRQRRLDAVLGRRRVRPHRAAQHAPRDRRVLLEVRRGHAGGAAPRRSAGVRDRARPTAGVPRSRRRRRVRVSRTTRPRPA